MTTAEVAHALNINARTVTKASTRYLRDVGARAPGHIGPNNYSQEFLEWYNARPENRSYLRGKRGDAKFFDDGREGPLPGALNDLDEFLASDGQREQQTSHSHRPGGEMPEHGRANSESDSPTMQPRTCQICHRTFTPPQRSTSLSLGDNHLRLCAACRRVAMDASEGHDPAPDMPTDHRNASTVAGAPMRQVVFDLETWGLDRGWGVTMIASFLIHGGTHGPERVTLRQRDSAAGKAGRRSDDREISEKIIGILKECHIGYAHNGDRFDVKWIRTVALKYGLEMPRLKLVDPCSIAWKKYLIGRNSLEAVADFLGISEEKEGQKVHLSPDVWRGALMDDDDECWNNLVVRCESDVEILNRISAKVTRDVGMVDYSGSWK